VLLANKLYKTRLQISIYELPNSIDPKITLVSHSVFLHILQQNCSNKIDSVQKFSDIKVELRHFCGNELLECRVILYFVQHLWVVFQPKGLNFLWSFWFTLPRRLTCFRRQSMSLIFVQFN